MNDSIYWLLKKYGGELTNTSQLLIVINEDPDSSQAKMYRCLQTSLQEWQIGTPVDVSIGRKGFALPGGKEEGDDKSPQGLFNIGHAFGYNGAVKTGLDYRQSTEKDIWVDDPGHENYNQWAFKPVEASSWEDMLRKDHQYRYGVVVEYNTTPVMPGKGSAVFLHIHEAPGIGTSACVAMEEQTIIDLLAWLDKNESPKILMGYPEHLLLTR